ncbi:MAG: TROVE domain-containing protein [Rhodobacterales bacterium]|nr:TROVE domain-containing protein [Rhodobacterales bacterium]
MSYRTVLQSLFQTRPQTQPLPGQVPNHAGGHVYAIDHWARLDRFLVLGSEGGTYYVGEARLTVENANAVQQALAEDGPRVVRRIVEISTTGRAPKAQPALFALALAAAAGDDATRQAALAALPMVARTGTHVLTFAGYADGLRGWGRGLRRGVARWFTAMDLDRLALQAVKYRQREGWSLRDLLRLAHPLTDERDRQALFRWLTHPEDGTAIVGARAAHPLIDGLYAVREAETAAQVADLVVRYSLPREAVPTDWLTEAAVWDALLVAMPMTAMIRNLGKMSAVGLVTPGSDAARYVAGRLTDADQLRGARVHPVQVLLALKTYAKGRGFRGSLTWPPVPEVLDALDRAYDASFALVRPTGQRILVAVDVSGSMFGRWGAGASPLTALEAAAAVTQVFLRTEPKAQVIAVDTAVYNPGVSPRQRLDDLVGTFARYGGGGTDLALPFQYAKDKGLVFDTIVTLTDNETWAGDRHPVAALAAYRRAVNPAAKAVVLAATSTSLTVVPEDDPLSLGIAGFDAAAPQLVGDFIGQ